MGICKHPYTLGTYRVYRQAQIPNPSVEPGQFFDRDGVVLRVPCLNISFLEFLEHGPMFAVIGWPDVREAGIKSLGLRPQKSEAVDMWSLCRAPDYAALA